MSNVLINPFAFGAPAGNGPDGTNYYVEVTIPTTSVTADLSDFPVYVDLSDLPAAFWSHVQPNGGDIRVTQSDGSTRCAAELVSINTGTSTGELHFLAAAISDATDTTFRVYYGHGSLTQPAVTAAYGRNAVWADYAAVFHGDNFTDSTGNGNTLAPSGTAAAGSDTAQMGYAFTLTNSHLAASDSTSLDVTGDHTLSAWARATSWEPTTDSVVFGKWDTGSNRRAYYLVMTRESGSIERHLAAAFSAAGAYPSGVVERRSTDVFTADSAYHHLVASCDVSEGASGMALYCDGAILESDVLNDDGTAVANTTAALLIGDALSHGSSIGRNWHGQIEEVRVRVDAANADWIAAEHMNQATPTTFYTVGSEMNA